MSASVNELRISTRAHLTTAVLLDILMQEKLGLTVEECSALISRARDIAIEQEEALYKDAAERSKR